MTLLIEQFISAITRDIKAMLNCLSLLLYYLNLTPNFKSQKVPNATMHSN